MSKLTEKELSKILYAGGCALTGGTNVGVALGIYPNEGKLPELVTNDPVIIEAFEKYSAACSAFSSACNEFVAQKAIE